MLKAIQHEQTKIPAHLAQNMSAWTTLEVIHTPDQHTLSTHPINTPSDTAYQHTLYPTLPLNPSSHTPNQPPPTLSTLSTPHPRNPQHQIVRIWQQTREHRFTSMAEAYDLQEEDSVTHPDPPYLPYPILT